MMEDDPDFGYYCETDDDGVTPVTKKKLIQYLEILRGTCLTVLLLLSYRSRTSILASLFSEDGSLSLFWVLFLESAVKFSCPKSQLSNSNPLVLKR